MSNIRSMIPGLRKSSAPLSPSELMHGSMNKFFQDIWSDWTQQGGLVPGAFVPTVETSETKNKIKVAVELPGMTDKDVLVSLSADGEYLTVSGTKEIEEETKDEENQFYHFERSYGSFKRHVPLPSPVDPDKINAKFKNGVLKITMGKKNTEEAPESRPIRIEV